MIGTKLFDYEITRKIKAGGMGVVYEAQRVWGKRERVAVKFLLEQLRDDEPIRRRFIREAEILEMLNHPRIVRILGLDPDRDAFVMEFVEGKTLSEHLRSSPETYRQPEVTIRMFAQLLDAFDYAHHVVVEIGSRQEQGVVHRDIKPSNIIIEPDGNPKILDFGISRISTFESTLTDPKLQMGSVAYMSPEQIVNPAAVDWRSDIYSLGVTLWEMFVGSSPYPQVTNFDMVVQVQNKIRNEPLPKLTELLTNVSAKDKRVLQRIDAIIAKATAKHPGQRYQRCQEMKETLKAALHVDQSAEIGVMPAKATDAHPAETVQANNVPNDSHQAQPYLEEFTQIQEPNTVITPIEMMASPVNYENMSLTPDGSLAPISNVHGNTGASKWLNRLQHQPRRVWALLALGTVVVVAGVWISRIQSSTPAVQAASPQAIVTPAAEIGEVTDEVLAALSMADSCYEVGYQYYQVRDYKKAIYWYQKAANLGSPIGQTNLGYMYEHELGVARNYTEALKWYQKAATAGNADGQNNLGSMYYNGLGTSKDYTQALKWYRAAAEQGNAGGQINLGIMYDEGHGVAANKTEALKWYMRAANQGNADGQYYVGTLYELGEGVEQNENKAVQWYRVSARQGNRNAQGALGRLNQTW
ncbi:hypothetical protein BN8_04191 [Fibrisoma limi BUZ 3]|uniref:Protein kinase domain-containing protein n=1 Tax=Fibrisoma limi BUZ 3 TaxID=1185876 RepID=I2GM40_9BACT|nr:serine/threonine-protein kinase [Fibrisoma limi]CCH54966.1 hypothetical protein BN8_04191 [Fibrisoma limi BUZ 3]